MQPYCGATDESGTYVLFSDNELALVQLSSPPDTADADWNWCFEGKQRFKYIVEMGSDGGKERVALPAASFGDGSKRCERHGGRRRAVLLPKDGRSGSLGTYSAPSLRHGGGLEAEQERLSELPRSLGALT